MSAGVLAVLASVVSMVAPAPCVLAGPQGTRAWGECGVVDVALDASRPSPTVPIAFARLPATSADGVVEPVVLLAGGPGQAATRDFVPLLPALARLRARHDIILIDVRGTGRSQPQTCADTRPLVDRFGGVGDDDVLAACAANVTLDPRFITTADAARDVDAVRVALGIERWDLVGVSYGTRLALVYDQRFPGRARAMVLDGFVAPDHALGDDIAIDMTASLRALGDESVEAFRAVKARLADAPVTVEVRHPTTTARLSLSATPAVVNGVVRMLLYGNETRAVLPQLLRAAREGDLAPLVALAVLSAEQLEGALHGPVNAAVLCAEDAPFHAPADQDRGAGGDAPHDAVGSGAGVVFEDERPAMRRQCERWPHATPARLSFAGTKTPTLVLSGEHDPITPPRHVDRVLPLFADGAHVVVPGHGHNVLPRGCVVEVVADFLASGTARGLDAACVQKQAALPAFIDAMGPRP